MSETSELMKQVVELAQHELQAYKTVKLNEQEIQSALVRRLVECCDCD